MIGELAESSWLPHHIGRYEIVGSPREWQDGGGSVEIAGAGGFERPVVVKRTLPHRARMSEFVDMFLNEARIIAGIRRPNVVTVHELGRDGGELFLVLEYLEGAKGPRGLS